MNENIVIFLSFGSISIIYIDINEPKLRISSIVANSSAEPVRNPLSDAYLRQQAQLCLGQIMLRREQENKPYDSHSGSVER